MSIRQLIVDYGKDVLGFFLLTVIWVLLSIALLVLLSSVVNGAPAPPSPEPPPLIKPPKCLIGKWQMMWSGVEYQATFYEKGGYVAKGYGMEFVGYWSVKRNVLSIIERTGKVTDRAVTYNTYEVILLPDSRRSAPTSTIDFSLDKP